MAHILIIYSTTDGHTRQICERLRRVLEEQTSSITLVSIDDAQGLDLSAFDKIVIGASIRYGYHSPKVAAFIRDHQAALEARPNAFFSVNIVARKPTKNQPHTNPYLRKFLKQISWKPRELAVFAGKLDYPRYGVFDRWMIRMIMTITRGPTDPQAVVEFTDWEAVEAFGRRIGEM